MFDKNAVNFDAYCLFLDKIKDEADIFVEVIGDDKGFLPDVKRLISLSERNKANVGAEHSQKKPGVNIVVYDSQNSELVDSVCFDLKEGVVYRGGGIVAKFQYVNNAKMLESVDAAIKHCKDGHNLLSDKFCSIIPDKKPFHKNCVPKATGLERCAQFVGVYNLIVFDKICRRLDISYTLYAGTLIGAVRGGGLSPGTMILIYL